MKIKEIHLTDEKSRICDSILRALPNWFGVEQGIVDCVRDVQSLPFFAAILDSGKAIGFAALKYHNEYTAEVRVMGVLEPYHRRGVGKLLIERCVSECRRTGREFLTVKTLDQSRKSMSYDKTRAFYHAMGFRPLEVFPAFWDAGNPCLFMAMYLG